MISKIWWPILLITSGVPPNTGYYGHYGSSAWRSVGPSYYGQPVYPFGLTTARYRAPAATKTGLEVPKNPASSTWVRPGFLHHNNLPQPFFQSLQAGIAYPQIYSPRIQIGYRPNFLPPTITTTTTTTTTTSTTTTTTSTTTTTTVTSTTPQPSQHSTTSLSDAFIRTKEQELSEKDNYLSEEEGEEEEVGEDDVETEADLLEGDIAVAEGKSRLAIDFDRFPAKKWKNQTVQYKISINHTMNEVLVIESAIRTISFVSCIKFEKWDGASRDYIHFQPHKTKKGCWSYIGRQGGRQQLSLERPKKGNCKCFCSPGRAMHEIMHSLGFYHEHARSDRDLYIKIVEKNVRPGKFANFRTMADGETARNFDYDYNSIMHYGPYFFSKNKRDRVATIVPKKAGVDIGQREMLSKTDCMKINSLYGCFKDPAVNRKIQIICAMVGI